jgi:hypothetical protein
MLTRQYMQFVTKTSSLIDLHVMCRNKEIANTNTKFHGLTLDNTFSWKNHIDISTATDIAPVSRSCNGGSNIVSLLTESQCSQAILCPVFSQSHKVLKQYYAPSSHRVTRFSSDIMSLLTESQCSEAILCPFSQSHNVLKQYYAPSSHRVTMFSSNIMPLLLKESQSTQAILDSYSTRLK